MDGNATDASDTSVQASIFIKIFILSVSSVLLWTPSLLVAAYEVLFGAVPPLVDAIAVEMCSSSPTTNSILILLLLEHYRQWAKDIFLRLRRRRT